MTIEFDWIIENANLVTLSESLPGYGQIDNGVVAIKDAEIVFAGCSEDWQSQYPAAAAKHSYDAQGAMLTPGLVDCHTHLVFGGNRAEEFEWRLKGESYQDIAKKGGGIVSTVKQTRALSEAQLFAQAAPRLERLLEEGVTTLEIKSGYGLTTESEIKMLRVAKSLELAYPVTIETTLLSAHAVPPEYQSIADGQQAYIDHVCSEIMPEAVALGLVDAVDVFCEGIGFTPQQCEQVFQAAEKLGLPIKGHVEQLSDLKGAVTAAKYNCLSVDHIEYLDPDDVTALKDTVAVLLPGAYYCLNETRKPPIQALREHNIPLAVASDLNPGTSPIASLLYAMNQACVLFGLTPLEALKGATTNGAKALGLKNIGRIEAGYKADLLLWNIQHPAELAYGVNFYRPQQIWQNGKQVTKREVA
ncbi:MAG: imidazolonepropionase [Arenicella sp.]|jgi:imidazolonepropionase